MKTPVRFPLWAKVLVIAVLNVTLLGAASVWLLRRLLAQDFGSILLGGARDRIVTVSRQLSTDLAATSADRRDVLLGGYSNLYGQSFHLFNNSGNQVAGQRATLPEAVARRVREGPVRGPGMLGRGPFVAPPVVAPFLVVAEPGYWVGVRMPIRVAGQASVDLGVLLVSSTNLITNTFLFDIKPWLAFLGGVLTITLICWLPLVGGMTRSIQKMMSTTRRIAGGGLDARVDVKRTDELGVLGDSVNRMTQQLEEHVNGQKRFLRDAAHELRSPLARMQAALGLLERQAGPESERLLEDLREEIDHMSTLTGELLTLARSETMPAPRLTNVNLAGVAARAIETENAGGAEVRASVDPALNVTANEDALFRGISNLVRNAIRYASDAGPITVAAKARDGWAIVTVADQGPGIPEEAIDKIFTPFYRLDVSRDRQTGGTGLGMSIARACIESCRGTIECRNANPGLVVTIALPLAAAKEAAAGQTS